MGTRLQLQTLLEQILGCPPGPDSRVYFQPARGTQIVKPAILYQLDDMEPMFADNLPFASTNRYQLTIVDLDPDTAIRAKVAALPMCRFDRWFAADNLNHFVFNLYF